MTCLDATFTLTPQSPVWGETPEQFQISAVRAELSCWGADIPGLSALSYSSLYSSNQFCFSEFFASNPTRNYTQWPNRQTARFLELDLFFGASFPAGKQLLLVFSFDLFNLDPARVQVYSDAAFLADQALQPGDNQFAIEIASLSAPTLSLYFIHAGGNWLFNGITGYLV